MAIALHFALLRPTEFMNIKRLWDWAYGLSSLSGKTRVYNHLQMSLQREHFLLSYLKTLSVLLGIPEGYPSYNLGWICSVHQLRGGDFIG